MTNDPREAAFDVMRAVDEHDAYVNLLLPKMLHERRITGRDAALATELTHGTIRLQGRYDAILNAVVTKGIASLEPSVRDAIRLGAHQILGMRIPAHAAVSTTVSLVRNRIGHKPAGLVNAVLRKIAGRSLAEWIEQVTANRDPVDALAIQYSHPAWIIEQYATALENDDDELTALLGANNEAPRVTLVARPGLCEPKDLPGMTGKYSPFARILEHGAPGDIAQVRDGRAAVQDEGSQAVTLALCDTPVEGRDEFWLDVCAGPGGKAGLMGAIGAQRGAHLVANEVQPHRAELVRTAVQQLPNVEVTVHDGRAGPWAAGSFDRILLDAPCSGLGALRRRPEARWRRKASDLDALTVLQHELLAGAARLLRPGGVLAYVTCSPVLAETRAIVDSVIAATDLQRIAADSQWWPHRHGTDAMYVALLSIGSRA